MKRKETKERRRKEEVEKEEGIDEGELKNIYLPSLSLGKH